MTSEPINNRQNKAVDTLVTSDSPRDDKRYAYVPLGQGPVLRALDNTTVLIVRYEK